MCDYSLELYRSIPAVQDETYKLIKFPSGTNGFVVDKEPTKMEAPCAVCIPEGSTLQLVADGETETVTMVRLDALQYLHLDAARFANGDERSLQTLPLGTKATVVVLGDRNAPEDRSLASAIVPAPDAIASESVEAD